MIIPARRIPTHGAVAVLLSSLLLAGCSPDTTSDGRRPDTGARPTATRSTAPPAASGMPALTTAQLVQRLLGSDSLGGGFRPDSTYQTGDDHPPGFRTLRPESAACTDTMASFAANPRVGRLSARQFAFRGLANATTGAGANEWVGSFSSPAQAEQAVNNLLRDAATCPAFAITSPGPEQDFTVTRLPDAGYGDHSAELLFSVAGVTTADPVLVVRYGANVMGLTTDTPHDRDALLAAVAAAADERFTGRMY